jgi:hypothetical protein
MVVSNVKFPLTKEKQLGSRSRKVRKKEKRERIFAKGVESELLTKCLGLLDSLDAPYLRLLEDWQWDWIHWNAPKQLKQELSDNFSGWADLIIFKPVPENPSLNQTLLVELKTPGKKMRKAQRKRADEVIVRVIDNYDVFVDLISGFYYPDNKPVDNYSHLD